MKIPNLLSSCLVAIFFAGGCGSADRAKPQAISQTAPAASETARTNPRREYPVVGHLAGRDNVITIKSSPQGPLYCVTTRDGKVLFQDLSAEQLRAQAPDVYHLIKTSVADDARVYRQFPVVPFIDASRVEPY